MKLKHRIRKKYPVYIIEYFESFGNNDGLGFVPL